MRLPLLGTTGPEKGRRKVGHRAGQQRAEASRDSTFKLKSVEREFSSDYELQVTDLKIPTGYDLEAV
jgi:hypothetical protein